MKICVLLGIVAGAACLGGGCATPGLSPHERDQLIARNMDYDGKQIIDDIDRDVLFLRPASHMTIWNVQDSY